MPEPLALYSTITKVAYNIGERYYGGLHYVWCAPQGSGDKFGWSNPPSSDPISIYWRTLNDIEGSDGHSPMIQQNRRGIVRGASFKEQAGVIDRTSRKVIEGIARKAPLLDFSPLMLVIPFAGVRAIAKLANPASIAGATSQEYIIENLPRNAFDVLEIVRR